MSDTGKRDPITQDRSGLKGLGGGSVSNASRDRVKSINGGGPNFSKPQAPNKGHPFPDSPYRKD